MNCCYPLWKHHLFKKYKLELRIQKKFHILLLFNNLLESLKKTVLPVPILMTYGNFFNVFYPHQDFPFFTIPWFLSLDSPFDYHPMLTSSSLSSDYHPMYTSSWLSCDYHSMLTSSWLFFGYQSMLTSSWLSFDYHPMYTSSSLSSDYHPEYCLNTIKWFSVR